MMILAPGNFENCIAHSRPIPLAAPVILLCFYNLLQVFNFCETYRATPAMSPKKLVATDMFSVDIICNDQRFFERLQW